MTSRVTRSRRLAAQQPEQQSRARWTMFLTKVLVDLLVDQVRKGNRLNNAFNKKAWVLLCDDFYKKTGLRWDKEQLKNRFAVLRRQYVVVKSLLDLTDFSWDESTGMVMGKDEAWTEYIKVCPFPLPFEFSLMKDIFVCKYYLWVIVFKLYNTLNQYISLLRRAYLVEEPGSISGNSWFVV